MVFSYSKWKCSTIVLLPTVIKCLQDFLHHTSWLKKMIKSWFFLEKMRHEKLYKNCINKFLLTCSDGSSILKMKKLHDSVTFHQNGYVWRTFYFAYISAWENDNILVFLLADAPCKALENLYKQTRIAKQERLSNIFITVGNSTNM